MLTPAVNAPRRAVTGGGFFDVLVPIPLCATWNSAWPLLLATLGVIVLVVAVHPSCRRAGARARSSTRALNAAATAEAREPPNGAAATARGGGEVVSIAVGAL